MIKITMDIAQKHQPNHICSFTKNRKCLFCKSKKATFLKLLTLPILRKNENKSMFLSFRTINYVYKVAILIVIIVILRSRRNQINKTVSGGNLFKKSLYRSIQTCLDHCRKISLFSRN